MFLLGLLIGLCAGIFLVGLGTAAKVGDAQDAQDQIKHLQDKLAEYERWEAA